MEIQQVVSILDSVASGALSLESPDVRPAISAASALLKQRQSRPTQAGARWTDDEDARLCREFDEGRAVAEIARAHNRSAGAINIRLVKLGRLEPDAVRVRDRS